MAFKVIIIIISQLRRPYQGNGTLEMCQVLHRENTDGRRSKKNGHTERFTPCFLSAPEFVICSL